MLYHLISLAAAATAVVAAPTSLHSRAPSGSKTVIIQMFEWSWDSIAAECTNFIGPAGYGFVQVSPPSEHITGDVWWTDYQPVSYILISKRGNRSQFQNAGVGVIADTIFNHMSNVESGTGLLTQDFHHCGLNSNDDIKYYTSRAEIQTCELDNLAVLATETEYVRDRLAAYANDLLSLGVVGLRLEAAKHIATADIANILGRLNSKPYITQEVIFGSGEPVQPSEYTANGDVQEFRYTTALRDAFQSGGISSLNGLENRVLSSYTFSTRDDGNPTKGVGSCSGSGGANGWQCQHRWTAIAGMVKWRNGVTGSVNNWVSGTNQQIAFGRGSSGFVVINNADSAWTKTFTTPLAANSYCDMISGAAASGKCTGASYTVSGGTFTATVPARSAIALFTGAIGTGSGGGSTTVNFRVNATTTFGDNIFLAGSTSQLGSWAPDSSIAMSSASYPIWTVSVTLPAGTSFSYKYLRKTSSGSVVWESDPNRGATAPSTGSSTLSDTWR
ncbi:unnamed protein product [Rhizoctonia solani]|uniref:alpha-amylase n=1 Tax=Rhizoctonia solani TaxID=456999 RepID=A0A8H3CNZ0_9AGAM|nr:unnamed protein product [Rhizoctonia solani]